MLQSPKSLQHDDFRADKRELGRAGAFGQAGAPRGPALAAPRLRVIAGRADAAAVHAAELASEHQRLVARRTQPAADKTNRRLCGDSEAIAARSRIAD